MNKIVLLAGVVIGALAVFLGLPLIGKKIVPLNFQAAANLPTPICEATVKLTLKRNSTGVPEAIIVDPPHPVCVALSRPVNWEIGDPNDVKLIKLEFKEEGSQPKGPFPADSNLVNDDGTLINKNRGIYLRKKAGTLTAKSPDTTGSYKYWVEWTLMNDTVLKTPDPVVCIRD
jgi:hypothetical protein